MSMRMRMTASTEQSATAITKTSVAIGRRNAIRMSHMRISPRSRRLAAGTNRSMSRVQQIQERLQVALRVGHIEKAAPYVQPRHRVVHLRLRQQIFGLGDVHYGRQARIVS